MCKKSWPKAPAKEGALSQISTNFQVYFTHINFLRNQTKEMSNKAKELYCDAAMFVF